MAIITLEEVHLLVNITTLEYDDLITALIPEVEAFIEKHCNEDFSLGVYPAGVKRISAEMIRYDVLFRDKGIGVSSESIADYSVTYDFRTSSGYPDKIIDMLKPYRRIKYI